jgi:inner membrane protein YidH
MTDPISASSRPDVRDHLAVERTFLAWIRTGLSLMGFGFVVARFGLFLQELQVVRPSVQARSYGLSLWFGTSLIVIGVIVNGFSTMRYRTLVRHLNRGGSDLSRASAAAIALALFLALIGLAMAIYLVSV